jgi:hypothetical protein
MRFLMPMQFSPKSFNKEEHMEKMKIGIVGSGVVGQALANGFIKHGFEVMMGSRSLSKLADWKNKAGEKGLAGSFPQAAAYADIIVLAVKGTAAMEALSIIGEEHLRGKIIIDATNPIADEPPVNGVIKFFTTLDRSLMEDLQAALPDAHFVKAFNSIGNAFMINPDFGSRPSMFMCGNSESAKKEVSKIIELFGFDAEDMGKAEAARAIEPLCMLWCIPGFLNNSWNHAFKLLKKNS